MSEIADAVRSGSRRTLARLLTAVENEVSGVADVLTELFPYTGNAWIIGVTGAPGTGKSSLVNALAKQYRTLGQTVAILAVDPTSPFSGGAILGDRIRMRELSGDKGVFIRSMATRGSLGGLARATRDAVYVIDAAGFDIIMVETVGAGQSEVDIVRTAHTTLVIEAPGLGDDVQAIKAGILEIADIVVVNKSDRTGADNTLRALKSMLELGHPTAQTHMISSLVATTEPEVVSEDIDFWLPPIVKTTATTGVGVGQLIDKIQAHREYLSKDQVFSQKEDQRVQIELYQRLQAMLMTHFLDRIDATILTYAITQIRSRNMSPQQAVQYLLAQYENI